MRLGESFKSINFIQLIFELIIVFIGVYAAFIFTQQKADEDKLKEARRVIALMETGIDRYEKLFNGFSSYHEDFNAQFKATLDKSEIPQFNQTYYLAPQYPIDVIDYLLTKEGYEVFTLDLYIPLTSFVSSVQRLMYVEAKLVEISEAYEPLPSVNHPDYKLTFDRQHIHALRYYRYLEFRRTVSKDLAVKANAIGESLKALEI